MRTGPALLAAALLAALAAPAAGAGELLYIEAGLVLPIDGEPIPGGRIIVRDGRIEDVGAELERPPFSELVDAREWTVTPGFVVADSSIGLPSPPSQGFRPDRPVKVGTRAEAKGADELYPLHHDYALLLEQGITTLGLRPVGTGGGVLGQISAIGTRSGPASAMTIAAEAAVLIDVDAHGPWREAIRSAFEKAAKTAEKEAKADEAKRSKSGGRARPSRRGEKPGEPSKDPLVRVVTGKEPLHLVIDGGSTWTAARDVLPLEAADIVVLDYGRTWEIAKELAEAGARVVTAPVLVNRPRTRMPVNRAAEYERAGVPFAFRLPTDDLAGAAVLRDQAIEMARTGAGRDAVLRALTLEGARALGLADKLGSIVKGRRADLLFWSDHPLEPLARLEAVRVAGELIQASPRAALRPSGAGA